MIEGHPSADRAAAEPVAESRTDGVSTTKMKRIARKMGIERLPKKRVSAVGRSLYAGIAEVASRDLGEVRFPTCSWTPPRSSAGGLAECGPRPS